VAKTAGYHATRVLGIGGSGVVTLSQILAAAATLSDHAVITLDQTGLAQKGGAVVSDVKIDTSAEMVAHKAAPGEVDLYLGADLRGRSPQLSAADPRRTRAVVSTTKVNVRSSPPTGFLLCTGRVERLRPWQGR
jgi:indolepyruvate ferredoxin oxidoreductase